MNRIFFYLLAILAMGVTASGGTWWKPGPEREAVCALPHGPAADEKDFAVGDSFGWVEDEFLQRPVFEHTGARESALYTHAMISGPYDITVRVRLMGTDSRSQARLLCGVRGDESNPLPSYTLHAVNDPRQGAETISLRPIHGHEGRQRYETLATPLRTEGAGPFIAWPKSYLVAPRFQTFSPAWDADFLNEIEASMAAIPARADSWMDLRIECRKEVVRIYRNGHMLAEQRPAGEVTGRIGLWVTGPVRVADFEVRRPAATPSHFLPVDLSALCNRQDMGGANSIRIARGTLPHPSKPVYVNKLPFLFPERTARGDHIDVGASVFHYRKQAGYFKAKETWPAPEELDPARIRVRIPNRPYQRLWLIAASDGAENHVPVVTVRFYRPEAGFSVDAVAEVPALTARSSASGAQRLPVALAHGGKGSLWLVPVALDSAAIASVFREELTLCVELTKQVYDYRSAPDPLTYDRFPGGLPSGVRIFAMTFEEAPIRMIAQGNRRGNTYIRPEQPVWQVALENLRDMPLQITVRVNVTPPSGASFADTRHASIAPGLRVQLDFPIDTTLSGLHQVNTETTVEGSGETMVVAHQDNVLQLPPETRRATERNGIWGLWWWRGGHSTIPDEDSALYLLRAAGCRVATAWEYKTRRDWGMRPRPHLMKTLASRPAQWAYEDPYDPEKYKAYSEEVGRYVASYLAKNPDQEYFALFSENMISMKLTYGILPRYIGEPEVALNEAEQRELTARIVTARAATEGIRRHAPKAKVLFSWGEFTFAVPFMRAGYPREYMDAIGLDIGHFERMPERPLRSVEANRLWILVQEMKRLGYEGIPLIHCESFHPSSHPLALGWQTSADQYIRSAVLSLALGATRFDNSLSLTDCADYWGSNHYGCLGIVGRRPEYTPKPAFGAYATMTRLLDLFEYDGYTPTGSLSAYCVRFRTPEKKYIHCLWTIRGQRSATLTLADGSSPTVIDDHGNEAPLTRKDRCVTVPLSQKPIWVIADRPADAVTLGAPRYDETPPSTVRLLDALDQPWTRETEPYPAYAENHWDMPRFLGPLDSTMAASEERGKPVWEITLEATEPERPHAPWYSVFRPAEPLAIPGKARALGVWAKGASNWGRIIYEIQDAKGETWISIGAKDKFNCDDIHSWSSFNFDGWRYLEFPLPGNLPGDDYREKDFVWWKFDADGIVDLPVKVTGIIVELRSHNIYVNEEVAVPDRGVQLDQLLAVYEDAATMTEAPVRLQEQARDLVRFAKRESSTLPNPIAELRTTGIGKAPRIRSLYPPPTFYDGTRVNVNIEPVAEAVTYQVYVAAYPDGSGAQKVKERAESDIGVKGLNPDVTLYFFATYKDAEGRQSKPSEGRGVVLRDEFPMK